MAVSIVNYRESIFISEDDMRSWHHRHYYMVVVKIKEIPGISTDFIYLRQILDLVNYQQNPKKLKLKYIDEIESHIADELIDLGVKSFTIGWRILNTHKGVAKWDLIKNIDQYTFEGEISLELARYLAGNLPTILKNKLLNNSL